MRQISRIDFQNNLVIIRYNDDADPKWVDEQVLVVNWRKHPNVERLAHVAYHSLLLLVEHPERVSAPDEALQEWLGRVFSLQPEQEHEKPSQESGKP